MKIKLGYKSNPIMGLCPIILYSLHFVTEAFMALITSIYSLFLHQQNITLIPAWKALTSPLPTPCAPHTLAAGQTGAGCSSKFECLEDDNSSASVVHRPVSDHTASREKKKQLKSWFNHNFLCPVFLIAAHLYLLHTFPVGRNQQPNCQVLCKKWQIKKGKFIKVVP